MNDQTLDIDQVALEAARQLTPDNDPQGRSRMQCEIIKAIRNSESSQQGAAPASVQPSPTGQGDALLESLVARWRRDADEVGISDNTLCQKIANCTMRHAAELQAALAARQPVGEPHPDDMAVDAFAAAMKSKMADARAKGRGGWKDTAQCSADDLSRMLRSHVEKGDPRDVANFCMMLHQRGEAINASLPLGQQRTGYFFTDDPAIYAMPGSGFHSGAEPPANAINIIPVYAAPPAQSVDLDAARREGHDCAIRYVLGYLNGRGDCGSTEYEEILNGCGRDAIIRSAVLDGELEFTGLGRYVEEYGTDEDRALIDSGKAVRNG